MTIFETEPDRGGTRRGMIARTWGSARLWRWAAAALAVTALALWVAALVARPPPDFDRRPVIALLRDAGGHALWAVRLAQGGHEIALDALGPPPPPAGKAYQLWLAAAGGGPPQPLGLLPLAGRKIVPEPPADIRLLTGRGELTVTIEVGNGGLTGAPSGPPVFRASLAGPG
jgi:anti-sigma-K factor RskA